MGSKAFLSLIVAVLVVGGALGGSFFAGVSMGKNQVEAAPQTDTSQFTPPSLDDGQQATGGQTVLDAGDLRQRLQSGDITPEEAAQLREQFQNQGGFGGADGGGFGGFAGGGGGGFTGGGFGGGGLTGTVASVDGNTITVETAQGPLQATIGDETTIRELADLTLADLIEGMQLTVIGQPGEDGVVEAISITIVPEGADLGGFGRIPGGGGRGGGGFGGGQ